MRTFTILAIFGISSAIRLTEGDKQRPPREEKEFSAEDIMDAGFDLMDESGDGEIDFDEGMKAAKKFRDVAVKRGFLAEGEVSDADLEAGLEWFGNEYDSNGNGKMCKEEMGDAMDAMMGEFDFDEADIADFAIEFADEDGSGDVDMGEAKRLMQDFGIEVDDEELERLGAQLDSDGPGAVSADELLLNLAQMKFDMGDVARGAVELLDENDDGEVDFDEGMKAAKAVRDLAVEKGIFAEGDVTDADLEWAVSEMGRKMDKNGNGKVCKDEVEQGLEDVLGDWGVSMEDVGEFAFDLADSNGNGKMSFDEAREAADWMGMDVSDEDLIAFGMEYDQNGDDELSMEELANAFDLE